MWKLFLTLSQNFAFQIAINYRMSRMREAGPSSGKWNETFRNKRSHSAHLIVFASSFKYWCLLFLPSFFSFLFFTNLEICPKLLPSTHAGLARVVPAIWPLLQAQRAVCLAMVRLGMLLSLLSITISQVPTASWPARTQQRRTKYIALA